MKKTILSIGGFLTVLLLVGAGCTDQASPAEETNNEASQKTVTERIMEKTGTNGENAKVTDLKLTAKALGDRTVQFEWEVPEDLASEAEGYRFSRDTEENPEVNKDNWWWERGPAHRELEWKELPTGQAHFRMCIVKDDVCTSYSNDVKVDVK